MKKRTKIILIILLILITLTVVFYYPIRSYTVMKIYSASETSKSVMSENGYKIKIPSGNMWYPFVITFNTAGFGTYSGTDADMSIMYNFGKFYNRKSSLVYDELSPYYSAFYGAYALSQDTGVYGFDGDNVNADDLIKAFKYDYMFLVLKSVGCTHPQFEVLEYTTQSDISYAGYDGWTLIEANIKTNGMSHKYQVNKRAYIQYGLPDIDYGDEFSMEYMYGRLYARYFPEYNSTIVIYVMAQDTNVINSCDENILSKTKILDK